MKNTIKTIAIWALVGGIFVGFLWLLSKSQASSSPSENLTESGESQLIASETLYDFGTISMEKGVVSKTFRISNNTAKDILVKEISTSCMCTTAYIGNDYSKKGPYGMPGHGGFVPKANEKIEAGKSRDVEVVFDPAAHGPAGVGPINRLVYLTDASGGTLQLEIRAEVTP